MFVVNISSSANANPSFCKYRQAPNDAPDNFATGGCCAYPHNYGYYSIEHDRVCQIPVIFLSSRNLLTYISVRLQQCIRTGLNGRHVAGMGLGTLTPATTVKSVESRKHLEATQIRHVVRMVLALQCNSLFFTLVICVYRSVERRTYGGYFAQIGKFDLTTM